MLKREEIFYLGTVKVHLGGNQTVILSQMKLVMMLMGVMALMMMMMLMGEMALMMMMMLMGEGDKAGKIYDTTFLSELEAPSRIDNLFSCQL